MGEKEQDPAARTSAHATETAADGGGVGPAGAANLNPSKSSVDRAAGGGGTGPVEASNLNLSKAGINRDAGGGAAAMTGEDDWGAQTPSAAGGAGPVDATNYNSSKSNIEAAGGGGGAAAMTGEDDWGGHTPSAAESAINNAHSNVKRELGGGPPDPAQAINTSHSGIRGLEGHASDGNDVAPGGPEPPSTETAIIKSKSNITNNRGENE